MDKNSSIWYNGKITNWDDGQTHVMSHVIHYGSGVFEGIKCYETDNGRAIFRLDDHIQRLIQSGSLYGMDITYGNNELNQACIDIVKLSETGDSYIRPIAFYGYDTLGVNPKNCPVNVAIATFYWGAYLGDGALDKGVRTTISPWKKFSIHSMPAIAKGSGHYLNSMLAVTDAKKRGFDEAILMNEDDFISEGSGQNIFIVKDGTVYTNDEKSSILLGITRDSLIKICSNINIDVIIKNISMDDLLKADEVFFSGTASEVTPVCSVDEHTIGNGKPGEITLKLQKIYMDIVRGKNDTYSHWLTII